jgi:uncharacterized coiled-coil protein SlyX
MDGSDLLPNDLGECHRLLLSAFQQATDLERRVAESEHQVAELNRVLSETSASYGLLQQEHAATLDELAWYKRWAYGRRRERVAEDDGQGHLFDLGLDLPANSHPAELASFDDAIDVQGHRRRRKKREIDWDKLPQIRHEHDLPEEEKICSCCGRPMDRIGEDGSPYPLPAEIRLPLLQRGSLCGSASATADSGRHRWAGSGRRGDCQQVW